MYGIVLRHGIIPVTKITSGIEQVDKSPICVPVCPRVADKQVVCLHLAIPFVAPRMSSFLRRTLRESVSRRDRACSRVSSIFPIRRSVEFERACPRKSAKRGPHFPADPVRGRLHDAANQLLRKRSLQRRMRRRHGPRSKRGLDSGKAPRIRRWRLRQNRKVRFTLPPSSRLPPPPARM